jgi:hypothetical protein
MSPLFRVVASQLVELLGLLHQLQLNATISDSWSSTRVMPYSHVRNLTPVHKVPAQPPPFSSASEIQRGK